MHAGLPRRRHPPSMLKFCLRKARQVLHFVGFFLEEGEIEQTQLSV
jgi:hypothetical protein